MAIRGPVGGPRQDAYVAWLAMHAGGPYEGTPKLEDFAPPWARRPPPDDEVGDEREVDVDE